MIPPVFPAPLRRLALFLILATGFLSPAQEIAPVLSSAWHPDDGRVPHRRAIAAIFRESHLNLTPWAHRIRGEDGNGLIVDLYYLATGIAPGSQPEMDDSGKKWYPADLFSVLLQELNLSTEVSRPDEPPAILLPGTCYITQLVLSGTHQDYSRGSLTLTYDFQLKFEGSDPVRLGLPPDTPFILHDDYIGSGPIALQLDVIFANCRVVNVRDAGLPPEFSSRFVRAEDYDDGQSGESSPCYARIRPASGSFFIGPWTRHRQMPEQSIERSFNEAFASVPYSVSDQTVTGLLGTEGYGYAGDLHVLSGFPVHGKRDTPARVRTIGEIGAEFPQSLDGTSFEVSLWGLTVPPPTDICPPPALLPVPPATVTAGDVLDLTIAAAGGWPLSYQWYHSGVAIPGAVHPRYSRKDVTEEDAGIYQVKVSNACGTSEGNPIEVAVVIPEPPDKEPPVVEITAPAEDDPVTVGPQIFVSGTASDNREVTSVDVRLNGGRWLRANGTTSWSLSLNLREGLNLIEAVAGDSAGYRSFPSAYRTVIWRDVVLPPSGRALSVNFVDDPAVDAMLPADVAGMDLPGVRVASWNNVQAAPTGPVDDPPVTWVLSDGTPVPGFRLSFQTNLDRARLPNLSVDGTSPGDALMWRGYLDVAEGSAEKPGAVIDVSGIPFTGRYDVYIYFDGDNGDQWRKAVFQISGPGIPEPLTEDGKDGGNRNWDTPAGEKEAGDYQFPVPGRPGISRWPVTGSNRDTGNAIRFSGLRGPGFRLKAWGGASSGAARAPVNGFQIVESADSDGDGLPNTWEVEHGLNPDAASGDDGPDGNPDSDGVTNLVEFMVGANPRHSNSDGDGLSDSGEIGGYLPTDPTAIDTDDDGIPDSIERFPAGWGLADPTQADSDGDGVDDGLEVALQTDPRIPVDAPGLHRRAVSVNFAGLDTAPAIPNVLNPGDMAGLLPTRNWINAIGATGGILNLRDSNGTPTTAAINWEGATVWSRETVDGVPATPNGTLFNGYLYSTDDTPESTITITGIPYPNYDLIVYVDGEYDAGPASLFLKETGQEYHFDDSRDFNGTFAQAFGTAIFTTTIGANFVIFNNVTSPDATLIARARNSRVAINGLQIVRRELSSAAGVRILGIHRAPNGIITLGWESTPGSQYFVEVSDSGKYWTVRRTRIVATGTTTIFTERPLPADRRRLYRVVKQ